MFIVNLWLVVYHRHRHRHHLSAAALRDCRRSIIVIVSFSESGEDADVVNPKKG
jgi:CTP synthase (UTP-ammonia lyase)